MTINVTLTQPDIITVTLGEQGPPGPTGPAGAAGLGIASAAINGSNHLILTRTDGSTIDAGPMPGGGSSSTVGRPIGLLLSLTHAA
jgi:hypothetical protein